jgi:hypothetical protein
MTVKFSTWIDSLVPVATTLSATDKFAIVTDAPDSRAITRDNLARAIYATVMTTDGDLITRSGGEPTRITRSGLADDTAFTNKYVTFSTIDAKGDLLVGTANDTLTRLAVGTNGYTLVADSATATGLNWVAPGATVTVSATAPLTPGEGDLWFDSSTAATFIYYDGFWVEVGASSAPSLDLDDLNDVDAPTPSDGDVLTYNNTSGKWEPAAAIPESIIDAKGDLIVGTADNAAASLAVGTDGQVLVADSSTATGLAWVTPLLEETTTRTANYTLALADQNKVVPMNGSSLTLTVPTNASVAFAIGSVVNVYNLNATDVTIAGASGVTVRNDGDLVQYGEVSLRKRGTNEWVVAGNLS